jgi:hypothetical protein
MAQTALMRLAAGFPVVVITGPRQSGKTTLARNSFPTKPYVSLENPAEREFAAEDPIGFLGRFPDGAVVDEVQRVPELLSWIQGIVDERSVMGQFVLTGSQQFDLVAGISQSLAGRAGRLELLPLSAPELKSADLLADDLETNLFTGGYPAIYARDVAVDDWLANYVATYVERDVRQLLKVRDLSTFHRFVKMCAARSGQVLNLTALGSDCGVSGPTARDWLSVLEASYVVTLVEQHHANVTTRLSKAPKLFFLDSGLMCFLLGIRDPQTLVTHISRGPVFETWVASEILKSGLNDARRIPLEFLRDKRGREIDLVVERDDELVLIEVKAGRTFAGDWVGPIRHWQGDLAKGTDALGSSFVIYGGDESQTRMGVRLVSWRDLALGGMPWQMPGRRDDGVPHLVPDGPD